MPDFDMNDPRVQQMRELFNMFADERETAREKAAREKKEADDKEAEKKKPGLFDFLDFNK